MASPYLMLFGMFSSGILLCYCEKEMVAHITDGETTAIAISKLYGGVILINCVGSFFLLFYLGLLVSQARTKYRAKAEKAGDDRADDRFSYPKLYAEGFSEEAKHFNCNANLFITLIIITCMLRCTGFMNSLYFSSLCSS